MDILDFQKKYGYGILRKIGKAAGFHPAYIYQITAGHKKLSFRYAERIVEAFPELDVLDLMHMHDKIMRLKAQRRRKVAELDKKQQQEVSAPA